MTNPYVSGRTNTGRTLVVYDAENPRDRRFVIDGIEAVVTKYSMFRDGGTQKYTTDRGVVVFPHRIGSNDLTPRLDDERVGP